MVAVAYERWSFRRRSNLIIWLWIPPIRHTKMFPACGGGRLRELVALGRLTVPERYKLLYKIFKCPWEHLYCYYFLKMVHPDRFDCSLSLLNQGGFPLPRNFYVCTWLCKIYIRNVWKVLPGKRKSWTFVNFTCKRHTSFLASVIYASKIYVGINNSIVSLLNFNRLGRGGEKLLMPSLQAMAAKFSNFS